MSRPAGSASSHRPLSASARLGISVLAGLAAGALVGFLAGVPLGVLTGIAAMGLAFVLIGTLVRWPMDADRTRANAIREDFNAGLEEIVVILAALGGLAGVVVLLIMDPRESGPYAGIMGLAGAFLTWAMVHLMYSSQYAYPTTRTGRRAGSTSTRPGRRATPTSSTSASTSARPTG